ncbi:predicted protein [Naegleria gruberi]|uniref:Predicted protein n=1 Tax=Naegleria gruberi TaxID=5762 RepID=D2W3E7_NAEGR|nr:uncharacterized protein NAEGRDRAFT_75919 [Naegleria gruberi]EFC36406.1 predicted protein [Naegleria gruberi]|eukprot:XP_002669150.1 predicted protein [Naegleria gruberi strain NEG-M]
MSDHRKIKPEEFNLVLIGFVDCGKSTLGGQLVRKIKPQVYEQLKRQCELYQQGQQAIFQRFGIQSWMGNRNHFHISSLMLDSPTQAEREISTDVNAKHVIELSACQFRIIDTPGHGDFIKKTIQGISMGNVCLMVVSASDGEFEAGFHRENLSFSYKQQLIYSKVAGIERFIVCVNKMDCVKYSEKRFLEIKTSIGKLIKTVGIKQEIPFIPICGECGDNVFERSENMKWYCGKTLTETLNNMETNFQRTVEECLREPLRIAIFKPKLPNGILAGYIISGMVKVGMTVQIPRVHSGELINVRVKNIQISHTNKERAFSNSLVGIEFDNLPPTKTGYIISDPYFSPCKAASRFIAQISIINTPKPSIRAGYAPIVHCGLAFANTKFEKLIGILNPTDSSIIIEENPSCLEIGDVALVELAPTVPLFVDSYNDCNKLGRIIIRDGRATIAVGTIVKVNYRRNQFTLFPNKFNYIVKSPHPFTDLSIINRK